MDANKNVQLLKAGLELQSVFCARQVPCSATLCRLDGDRAHVPDPLAPDAVQVILNNKSQSAPGKKLCFELP